MFPLHFKFFKLKLNSTNLYLGKVVFCMYIKSHSKSFIGFALKSIKYILNRGDRRSEILGVLMPFLLCHLPLI